MSSLSAPPRISALEAGYIAHQLRRGTYTDIPTTIITPGGAADVARNLRAFNQSHPGVLEGYIRRRQVKPQPFDGTVRGLQRHSVELEKLADAETLKAARDVLRDIPSRAKEIEQSPHPFEPFGHEDALVLTAARWFKHEYFRWVDPIKCAACGGATRCTGGAEPNAEEKEGGAGRCEIWECEDGACGARRRFPRYNTVKALMGSREGRCGEFAQLFYVFLLVLGLEARYVWNAEDHVWTEYWSPEAGHWVHVDSCEAESSKPLLYARGWGKKQSYCLAFGRYGAEDVTRAYVDDWDECLLRRAEKRWNGQGCSEERLKWLLLSHTVQCRAHLEYEDKARLESMDEAQARWIADEKGRWAEAERANLKGRDSGTEEWKEERGETGEAVDKATEEKARTETVKEG